MSLIEKYGLNEILFIFLLIPKGLFDPVICKKNKWKIVIIKIINGKIKWIQKNRVNVGFLTENPPQIHCTKNVPKYGIEDSKFVITVDPQNDICPQGNTYPINAVPIIVNNINTPIFQVSLNIYDLK